MFNDYNLCALVVDDMATMRSMMKSQLASIGVAKITEAPNAAVAIAKLRAEKFDLLLIDYYLGDATDGQQLLELVRHEKLIASSAVAVMVTAETAYGSVAQVAEHSPDAYLIKPFTADTLHDRLLPVLERKLGLRRLNKKTPGLKPIYDQYDAGRYAAVVALVDAYSQREGTHADTARLKGDALMQQGDYVRALEHYQSLQENYAWSSLGVARVQVLLHQTDAAIATLEQLVAESPKYVHASDVLAEAYIKANQPQKALELLEAACANSPTVNRMRATAQLAEQVGDDSRIVQWGGKVVDANKFALVQDYTDHARLVRGLVKSGQMDKAISTMARFETEIPQIKQSASVQASKSYVLAMQLAQEKIEIETMPDSIKSRRLPLLAEKQERLNTLIASLGNLEHSPKDALFVSEAYLVTGHRDKAAESASSALANGQRLFPGMDEPGWREEVEVQAITKTKARIVDGLNLLRAGKTKEALVLFMKLVEHTPPDLTAQLLANVVTTVIALKQKGQNVGDFMPAARAALERLKTEYPGNERLPGLIQSFETN
ncbi:MAG: response regulator [Pseudomonadota bacterium]|nr:response regulator [Pseudomonadota bacterium]